MPVSRAATTSSTSRSSVCGVPPTPAWPTPSPSSSSTRRPGRCPTSSFVDPSFANEDPGQSGDYHPHGDIRAGESFLSLIYHAVRSSPAWEQARSWSSTSTNGVGSTTTSTRRRWSTTPSGRPSPRPAFPYRTTNNSDSGCPASWSRRSRPRALVHAGPYEHTSVLSMIEWRWGLDPLTARDANARNLAEVLDFGLARTDEPDIPAADGIRQCAVRADEHVEDPSGPGGSEHVDLHDGAHRHHEPDPTDVCAHRRRSRRRGAGRDRWTVDPAARYCGAHRRDGHPGRQPTKSGGGGRRGPRGCGGRGLARRLTSCDG